METEQWHNVKSRVLLWIPATQSYKQCALSALC